MRGGGGKNSETDGLNVNSKSAKGTGGWGGEADMVSGVDWEIRNKFVGFNTRRSDRIVKLKVGGGQRCLRDLSKYGMLSADRSIPQCSRPSSRFYVIPGNIRSRYARYDPGWVLYHLL